MDNIFSGLSIIIVIAAAMALLMRTIRQPLLIGHILTGIIVGPALFHVLKDPNTLKVFGDIGIALLLFIIGLGMNPRIVKEVGRPSFIIGFSQVLIISVVGYFGSIAVGLSHNEALFVGFGLSINSTIVALKLLSDRRETGRLYGKLTIGASLVNDILAAVALLLVASVHNGHWLSWVPLISLALKGIAIGCAMYLVSTVIFPKIQKLLSSDQEMLFLFAMAWGLGGAALLARAGFSLEVGALAAGVSLATMPFAQEVASRLRPLRDFFIIVFFITLGTELSFHHFSTFIWPIILAVLIVVVIKPIFTMICLGLLGYTKRTSFKTSIALGQVSEFSIILVLLGVQQHLINQHTVTLLTFIALITIAISTYLVTFGDRLYVMLEKYLDLFERRHTKYEERGAGDHDFILFGYQKGGHEFVKVFKQLKRSFVVVDYDPEVIESLEQKQINYLYGDATDVEMLDEAGIRTAKLIVSTITDFDTTSVLLRFIQAQNKSAVIICQADNAQQATDLYHLGASYVMLPHYIGSEKISAFIKKSGLKKSAFNDFRKKHLEYLEAQFGNLEVSKY